MTKRAFLSHSGIVPPFPDVGSAKKTETGPDAAGFEIGSEADCRKSLPSKLLGLIRSHEKKDRGNEDYEENIQETVDLFNHMIAVYSRHGLLRGDSEKAEQILSNENSGTKWGGVEGRKRGGKKGKRKNKDDNSDDLRIQRHDNGVATSESSISQQQDEALIFIAILRIFTTNSSSDETKKTSNGDRIDEDQALLISLSAELCLAISQHVKVDKESDTCNLAEYELLAQSGKAILTGLVNIMKMVEFDMRVSSDLKKDDNCLTLLECNEQTHVLVLNSSIKLACSLVSLFGTKLSRSTALLLDLNTIGWKLLSIDDDSVQVSAARLLSCLPLAGGIDRKSPSEIWSAQILGTLTALSTVLQTMAPLTQINAKSAPTEDLNSSNGTINNFLGHWIRFVRRDISDEQFRLRCFYRFSRGLTKVFQFFLLQDGLDRYHSNSTLVDAQIDIKKILGVVESLVSFPLSSETVYYRTKRRLRDETIDNGLLSPRIIATEAANHIKLMGHDILDCTLAAVGGPTLLPYARRILRITYASILTSSSSPVRKVMDPTSAAQLVGKKRRWLHLSVTSRSVAIKTFGNAIVAFGCDYSSFSPNHSKAASTTSFIASTDSEKAITLVVGCLVEQISKNYIQRGDYDDDWGTNLERTELISASAACLSMSIVSYGGFLSMPIRSLIESVVVNALSQICGTRQPSIQLLSWSLAKISLLRLACTCITTPWQDGASSALVDLLSTTANRLKNDVDNEVSLNAHAALRLCNTVAVNRSPALTYVTRAVSTNDSHSTNLGPHSTTTDANSLAANIESARNEAVLARKKMEEMELAKKRKADEKRQREEKGNQEKAAKRQKALAEKKNAEKLQKSAQIAEASREPANDTKIDDDTKTTPELKDENHSAKPDVVAEGKVEEECNNASNSEELIDDTGEAETKEDKMETDEKMDIGSKNDSDNEAFPEIFDGGPDSDDE